MVQISQIKNYFLYLRLSLKNIQINVSQGKVVLAIWANNRTDHLFCWRIPVQYEKIPEASGKNFLPVEFDLKDDA